MKTNIPKAALAVDLRQLLLPIGPQPFVRPARAHAQVAHPVEWPGGAAEVGLNDPRRFRRSC